MQIDIYRKGLTIYDKQSHAIWQNESKKHKRYIIIFIITSIVFLGFGYLDSKNTNTFWNLSSSLGIAFIIVAVINMYHLSKSKSRYFNALDLIKKHWGKYNTEIHIKLTDEGVFYKDSERIVEKKWSVFTSYQIEDDIINLIEIEPTFGGFYIAKEELSTIDLNELLSFLHSINITAHNKS